MKTISLVARFAILSSLLIIASAKADDVVLVEVESFDEKGGWVVDQQFMDLMGSPYLLAHGLGVPVPDATGEVTLPEAGEYRVWVRTRDWVAPWKAPGAPGRFKVLVNGKPLDATFGTEGDPWHWQDGGLVEVGKSASVTLHDLTGFEGRCDAILFCKDVTTRPPDGGEELAKLRAEQLGWKLEPEDAGEFDLVVIGGGVAGTSCAVSAARQGLRVALIQDRPVLGGNGSSEVRVWPEGHVNLQPYPHVGDIVREVVPPHPPGQAMALDGHIYEDARRERLVRAESNITLMLNHRAIATNADPPSGTSDGHIRSVIAQHTYSGRRKLVRGKYFADCTGDGVIGAQAGADNEVIATGNMGVTNPWSVGAIEQNEPQLKCLCKDLDPWSFNFKSATQEQPFPRCPWAIDMTDLRFPGRKDHVGQWPGGKGPLANLGRWFWESGSGKHPIDDMEWVRDYNLRAMYGAWDALKNVDNLYPNHRLKWAAFIAGKRESRRLLGDVILTADDFRQKTHWPDPAFPCTWHIDLHHPDKEFLDDNIEEPFISRATDSKEYHYKGPYWAPYRCLYSRNVDNLFMAGRDVSCSRDGLGAIRVMRTCGMMGETVGRAAWVAVRYETSPRGVYEQYLSTLLDLLKQPGVKRRGSLLEELEFPEDYQPPVRQGAYTEVLKGIVVDDSQAVLAGDWRSDGKMPGFVGEGYQYTSDREARATYPIKVDKSGSYEVRINWKAHSNRAQSTTVIIKSSEGSRKIEINQRRKPAAGAEFASLGRFRFASNRDGSVTFAANGSPGFITVDAVQLLPVDEGVLR